MFDTFVGIDISKNSFDIAVVNSYNSVILKNRKFPMTQDGFLQFLNILSKYDSSTTLIAMEATGCYHFNLLDFLLSYSFNTTVINPFLIKSFSSSFSVRKTKTDKKDALTIAFFAKEKSSFLHLSVKSQFDSIRTLIKAREAVTDDIASYKVRLSALLSVTFPELTDTVSDIFTKTILNILIQAPSAKAVTAKGFDFINSIVANSFIRTPSSAIWEAATSSIGTTNQYIEMLIVSYIEILLKLIEQREVLEAQMKEIASADNKLAENIAIISSIPGIKPKSALCILAETGIFDKEVTDVFANHRKLTAFFGTDPSVKQSGTSVRGNGSISKRGNPILRKKARNLAFTIVLNVKIFKDYYNKKINEGKCHTQALIAVWNKVLRVIFAMLKNRVYFIQA